jgi:hypothetical protein
MDDLYNLLGVPPTATNEEIKQRFRYLAQAYHPDKFSSYRDKKQAEEDFKKISAAYQILSNPEKRASYDRERFPSGIPYQQKTQKSHYKNAPSYVRTTASTKEKSSQKSKPKARNYLIWIGISLLAICVVISVLVIGLSLLSYPASQSNSAIPQKTKTPKPIPSKTATKALSAEVVDILTEVSAPPTLTPTLLAIGQSIKVNEKYSNAVWEISVERILLADSLTSPLTGRVDKASGRFAIIFLSVANRGLSTDNFVSATGQLEIRDAEGKIYSEHLFAPMAAQEIYKTGSGLDIPPDATAHIVTVFDISTESKYYILQSSTLSTSESSGLYLDIP